MSDDVKTGNLPPQAEAVYKIIESLKKTIAEKNDIAGIVVSFSPGVNNHTSTTVHVGTNSLNSGALPTGPNTRFAIASNTKSLVSTLIVQLFTAQNLSLDTPLGTILTQYENTPWGAPTIRQLLNMTSGIADYLNGSYFLWDAFQEQLTQAWTPDDIVNAFIQRFGYVTNFQPGQGWYYSNLGYIILSQVVEKLSGNAIDINLNNLAQKYHLDMIYKPEIIINDKNSKFVSLFAQYYFDGKNFSPYMNQSFFSGAGGCIASVHSTGEWPKLLIYTNEVLTQDQQNQLCALVSYNNGQPVSEPTPENPYCYGLGVAKMYLPGFGPCWWYEGNLFGSTVIYFFVPTANMGGLVEIVFAANTFNTNIPGDTILNLLNAIGAQPSANFATEISQSVIHPEMKPPVLNLSDKYIKPIKSSEPIQFSAKDANYDYVWKGNKSPYDEAAPVWEIVLEKETQFIRLFSDPKNFAGKWLLKAEDIKNLSPQQIQEKFALPYLPKYITDVSVPAGTKIRYGTAACLHQWGDGGATQFELLDAIPSSALSNIREFTGEISEALSSNYSPALFMKTERTTIKEMELRVNMNNMHPSTMTR